MALEIKDNYKTIGMHNNALKQNLERLSTLVAERSSAFKLFFRRVDKATWSQSTFVNENDPVSFFFLQLILR
jgi:hypothetical protein